MRCSRWLQFARRPSTSGPVWPLPGRDWLGHCGGDRDDQPTRAWSNLLRDRHWQHGDADHRSQPQRIAEFDDYLHVLTWLLRGDEVDYTLDGLTAPIKHLMPDDGFVRHDPVPPVYVSAFGPVLSGSLPDTATA